MRAEIAERWQGLDERVNAKLTRVAHIDRSPEKRFADLALSAPTAGKRISWLRKAADRFAANLVPVSACRSGCAHCCHIGVAITKAEATRIAKETGVSLNAAAGMSVEAMRELSPQSPDVFGGPCTFLDHQTQRCSIYDNRPLQCRLLFNLDEDDLLCQLVEGGAPNVPYANAQAHHFAAAIALGEHQLVDDIRRWFPSRGG